MKVAEKHVVSIDYTLKSASGEVLDTTRERDPLLFIQGMGQIIPGLERALDGKVAGESLQVTVDPEDAYGHKNPELVHQVPRSELAEIQDLQVGTMLQANTPGGVQVFTVSEITDEMVMVDGNHPLAGQQLFFDVTITDVREATEEELNPKPHHGGGCCGGGHHHHEEDHEKGSCCGGKGHGHGGGGHCNH